MRPLLVYYLRPITNWSFETAHTANTNPPGWDITGSVNGDLESQGTLFHSAGDGTPSLMALRQNVTGATAGNKSLCRQRISVASIPDWMRTGSTDPNNTGLEFAVAAMFFGATELARQNAYITFKQFDGGTATVGTGTELTPARLRGFECSSGAGWSLMVFAAPLRIGADYVDLEIGYDISRSGNTYSADANAYWDRCFFGALADLERGFRRFDITGDPGYEINRGNGRLEIVKAESRSTEIEIEIRDVFEGSKDDAAYSSLWRHLAGDEPALLAIWQDRSLFTNATRHFQFCAVNPKQSVKYPAGVTRKDLTLKLIAAAEWGA